MKTITLKKPTYIGSGPQVAAIAAENATDGTFSQKKTSGRIAAGLYLKGGRVALIRLGGSRVIVPSEDAADLDLDVESMATLASVDRKTGEIILAI